MQVEIDFTPTCVDVVSTKNRKWNLKHSGNLFYTKLVHSRVIELKDFEDLAAFRRVAEEIVDTIIVERGGRFLKLKDGERNSTRCLVMKRREATNKVIHALRSAHLKLNLQNIPGVVSQPMKKLNVAKTINKSQAPRGLARSKRSSAERVFYQAEEGNQPIHKYALYLISLVCNQADPAIAYQILNKPSQEYNVDTEPEKERLMRLQMRHRYASASAIGMSPVEFSRKLLDLWGCNLRIQKVPPHSPQQLTPQNKATDNPLIAREPVPQLATPAVTRSELAPSEAPSMDQIPLE